MAKLFVVSDIHSFYTPLMEALNEKGFDPNNDNHWLIVCGDAFDRGNESEEVFRFLMSLERKILIRGNHDILLEACCKRGFAHPYGYDDLNGTTRTINDIGGAGEGADPETVEQMNNALAQVKYGTIVVTTVPVLILYAIVQKYFEKGVMIGSVKG